MPWTVRFHEAFEREFQDLSRVVKTEFAATAQMLAERGPQLGRPAADTLGGSKHANMKELRFRADNGVWRVAFAFDPRRRAIVLVAGDKAGVSQKRFYKMLIQRADDRFDEWLNDLAAGGE